MAGNDVPSITTATAVGSPVGPAVRIFTCESCGGSVEVKAMGLTVTAVCSHCHAISEISDDRLKVIQTARDALVVEPLIPIGAKGKLRGQIYQVIGFMERFEPDYPADPWHEYLIWNPFIGFKWLVESKYHWNLVTTTKSTPRPGTDGVYSFLGQEYKVYHRGEAEVAYVLGEFYWQVQRGQKVATLDLIHPPFMLSKEETRDETVWSLGEDIDGKIIQKAFNVPIEFPTPIGISANQSFQGENDYDQMMWVWILAVIALIVIQILTGSFKKNSSAQVASTTMVAPFKDVPAVHLSLASRSHLVVKVDTSANNSWVEVEMRLANNDGSHNVETGKTISYYYGSDSDGSWTEGSQSEEFLFNEVPRGEYTLYMSGTVEGANSVNVHATVETDKILWTNFWLGFFLISLVPLIFVLRKRSFEHQRWSDSEFNPYAKEES